MVADDSLIRGQHNIILPELLCTEISIGPVVRDVGECSRDTVLVYLRLPV